jgi:hypothetical protein
LLVSSACLIIFNLKLVSQFQCTDSGIRDATAPFFSTWFSQNTLTTFHFNNLTQNELSAYE